jgi:hypothetical protein
MLRRGQVPACVAVGTWGVTRWHTDASSVVLPRRGAAVPRESDRGRDLPAAGDGGIQALRGVHPGQSPPRRCSSRSWRGPVGRAMDSLLAFRSMSVARFVTSPTGGVPPLSAPKVGRNLPSRRAVPRRLAKCAAVAHPPPPGCAYFRVDTRVSAMPGRSTQIAKPIHPVGYLARLTTGVASGSSSLSGIDGCASSRTRRESNGLCSR